MSSKFESNLHGTTLFKKVVVYLIAYIVTLGAYFYTALTIEDNLGNIVGLILLLLLMIVVAYAFMYQLTVPLIEAVSFKGEKFSWDGSFGSFMSMNIKGVLLSVITLGIYSPWYLKNIIKFFSVNTKYPGKEIDFLGTGGKLLKYIILSLILPLILVIAAFTFLMMSESIGAMILGLIIYLVGLSLISGIYCYLMYKWSINFQFGQDKVVLEAEIKDTALFIIGQFLLIIITLGIYTFAAEVKIFGYFVNKTVFVNQETGEKRSLHFTGRTGEGFLLLLIQCILVTITLGVYYPWAYAKIQNWLISNVELLD